METKELVYTGKFLKIYLLYPLVYELYWTSDTKRLQVFEYEECIGYVIKFFELNDVRKGLFSFQDLVLNRLIFEQHRPFVFLKQLCDNPKFEEGVIILPKDLLTHIVLKKFIIENSLDCIRIFVNYEDALNWLANS